MVSYAFPSLVIFGIFQSSFLESLFPENTAVACTAGFASGRGIVTAPGQAVVHAELHALFDNAGLVQADQGGEDPERMSLDTCPGACIGHGLESPDEVGSAVRITGIV